MRMVDDFLIVRDARVRQAMRQLEAAESRTLLVVDEAQALYGTLTDGDVRRWILGGGDLDGRVRDVCHADPFVVDADYDLEAVRREMLARSIVCIPVVGADRRVLGVLLWDRVFGGEDDRPARAPLGLPVIIMAGGAGTRLAPFTTVLPKPLIPIGGKTVIELIVDTFTKHGVSDFYLSVHHKSRIIKSYFDELDPPYAVHYLYEDQPLGTAGGLRDLAGKIDGDLIVTNCDVIIRADYHDLVAHHRNSGNDVTMVVSMRNFSIPYGVCEIENGGQLREIREKPQYDLLVNTGLYVIKPAVLELIPEGTPFDFPDLIAKAQATGGRVGVYPIGEEAWIDTGAWSEYRTAAAALSADRRKAPR